MSFHHSPQIVTDGLILCLDAADPKSYSGSGTTWYDRSNNNYNASLVNGVAYNDGNLVFDGVSNYCKTSPSQLDTTSCTGEVWIYPTKTSGAGDLETIICKFYNLNQFNFRLQIGEYGPVSNSVVFLIRSVSGTNASIVGNSLDLFEWHNITFTIDYINNNMSLYLNSNLIGSSNIGFSMPPIVSDDIYIGSSDVDIDGGRFYGGFNIGNIKFYNKVLSPTEILQNYNAQKGRFGL